MRILYRLLTTALTPLALIRLQRGPVPDGESGRWRERLGRIPEVTPGRIWIHAASVGEVNAAQGLVQALLARGEKILLSTVTATGGARCLALFGTRVDHRYLALDNPLSTRSWLARARPRLALIVETEIWPELFGRCQNLGIPLFLVSARVSGPAMARYRRFGQLFETALSAVELALCQSELDAERLQQLGLAAEQTRVTGNLKFDLALPAALEPQAADLAAAWGQRPCWTAGSTRPGEEEQLLEAHRDLLRNQPDALLVLAPRHPQRAGEIGCLLDREGWRWCRLGEHPDACTQVVLVDRLGALLACYAASQVAFVGGSLVALGGHNLLEPALLTRPVLAGPHLDQQAEARTLLEEAGGLVPVASTDELGRILQHLLQQPEQARRVGEAARLAAESGRGSLERTLQALAPWLEDQSVAGAGAQ